MYDFKRVCLMQHKEFIKIITYFKFANNVCTSRLEDLSKKRNVCNPFVH